MEHCPTEVIPAEKPKKAWKVFRKIKDGLDFPYFWTHTPLPIGEVMEAKCRYGFDTLEYDGGFHVFSSWWGAWRYKSLITCSDKCVVKRVLVHGRIFRTVTFNGSKGMSVQFLTIPK